jgi:hypothetical protein
MGNSSKSPQATRHDGADPHHHDSEERLEMRDSNPHTDPTNDRAWEHLSEGGDQKYDVGRRR